MRLKKDLKYLSPRKRKEPKKLIRREVYTGIDSSIYSKNYLSCLYLLLILDITIKEYERPNPRYKESELLTNEELRERYPDNYMWP